MLQIIFIRDMLHVEHHDSKPHSAQFRWTRTSSVGANYFSSPYSSRI